MQDRDRHCGIVPTSDDNAKTMRKQYFHTLHQKSWSQSLPRWAKTKPQRLPRSAREVGGGGGGGGGRFVATQVRFPFDLAVVIALMNYII